MGAVTVRVSVLAVGLLGLTLWQLPVWRSDVALWSSAAQWNRSSPRPACNLGLALRQRGQFDPAIDALIDCAHRAQGHVREGWYRVMVSTQLQAMEWTGVAVCDSERVRPYCL